MHFTLKLTQIGNSVGVILPQEVLAALKLEKGDAIHLSESLDGFLISPYNPALADELELGREFMTSSAIPFTHWQNEWSDSLDLRLAACTYRYALSSTAGSASIQAISSR